MFKYNEKDLYDRCGAIDVSYNPDHKSTFDGEFAEVGGTKIPIMNFHFQPDSKFTRGICLRTMFGYIPIENITQFRDIFDRSKYCQDETEWSFLYDEERASEKSKEQVKKLSLTFGKHWNGK